MHILILKNSYDNWATNKETKIKKGHDARRPCGKNLD
jgi:hypothetical protein